MTSKICAIVGFGPGVSLGVARAFGQAGYALALMARNPVRLSENAQTLSADFEVRTFAADAGDEASLVQTFTQLRTEWGDPEVLVYNAYAATPGVPSSLSAAALISDFAVNVAGALVAVQQVLPAMRANRKGTILLTGGGFALQPFADFASLSVGKAGIRNLNFSLAQELASSGIHVATVTICGVVEPGTHFDPDKIAEFYLALHKQSPDAWETEVMYK